MANIVSYLWDFGNGVTSTLAQPSQLFTPGTYDITVTITYDDDTTETITENGLIVVGESEQNLYSENYLTKPKSYNYGFNSSYSLGWSRNSGDDWVWPESQYSVVKRVINGIEYLVVWDMFDNKPYIINPRNTSTTSVTHMDKETTQIKCSAVFPAVTGESTAFNIMHQESIFHIRRDVDTKVKPSLVLHASLIGEDFVTLERKRIPDDMESVFKEQTMYENGEHKYMQLKFEADKSGFVLSGVDSDFKVIDRPEYSNRYSQSDSCEAFANVSSWVTRRYDNALDLATGSDIAAYTSRHTGPDDIALSAATWSSPVSLGAKNLTGSVVFWSDSGAATIDVGVVTSKYVAKGNYWLYYYTGAINTTISIPASQKIFDFRVLGTVVTTDQIDEYVSRINDYIGD